MNRTKRSKKVKKRTNSELKTIQTLKIHLKKFLNLENKRDWLTGFQTWQEISFQRQENQSTTDFSSATLDTRRRWENVCLVIQGKHCDPRILHCSVKYSIVAQMVSNPPATWKTWVRSLSREDPLEKGMATHSNILPRESHGQRNLEGYSAWGHKESDRTEQLSTHTFMWEQKEFFQLKKTHNGCHPSIFLSKLLEGVL